MPGEHGRAMRPGEESFEGFRVTLWRWRDHIQNDFAARMDWTILPYSEANRPPVPTLGHAEAITVTSGEYMARISLIAPEVQKPETTHVILRVTDRGTPPLSRYRRVIVTIHPD